MKARANMASAMTAIVLLSGIAAVPLIGQESPESLLPPGFETPEPETDTQTETVEPMPEVPPVENVPAAPLPQSTTVQPLPSDTLPGITDTPQTSGSESDEEEQGDEQDGEPVRAVLPPRAQRSVSRIGLIDQRRGGFGPNALAGANGNFLLPLLNSMDGTLASRWATILLRRVLVSQTAHPDDIDPVDWAAARARLLLAMGESGLARELLQAVDNAQYRGTILPVARDVMLANGDVTGLCPLIGLQRDEESTQDRLSRLMCDALAGYQSRAIEQIDRANREEAGEEIDRLLTEKVAGAAVNGRRAVAINWDDAEELTLWRFGLAKASGIEPDDRLYQSASRQYQAWRFLAPSSPLESRLAAADTAAAMGVVSNAAMVDLYSMAYDDPAVGTDWRARAGLLRAAYAQRIPADRLAALEAIWQRSENPVARYGALVLTARAAARFPVSSQYQNSADQLIAAMYTAGLDRNAAAWRNIVEPSGLGWALITALGPEQLTISRQDIEAFYDWDESTGSRKTQFLIAALAGLERADRNAIDDFASDNGFVITGNSRWSRTIDQAAGAGSPMLVTLLSAVGLQARDWAGVSPAHLYHIISAYRQIGMISEARMIAAEAITRS